MNKAVFLDRDGVINRKAPREDEYITRWEEMEILPGVGQAIAWLNRVGFQVIVVTNQRGAAKGLITIAQLESIHERMCQHLACAGARIHGIYYCPHELEPPCTCRKPKPGMLLEAARAHNIDLVASWIIGDSEKDMEAGKRAGCRTARLIEDGKSTDDSADVVASSLLGTIHKILELEGHLPVTGLESNRQVEVKQTAVSHWLPGIRAAK
jgi:D-glycero-D-manno-heptose 1,7-bisphosphate phosphatase